MGRHLGVMEREGGDPERTITGERPLTCDYMLRSLLSCYQGAPFDARKLLCASTSPVFPLSVGQRCCIPTLPIAGKTLRASTILMPPNWSKQAFDICPLNWRNPVSFGDIYVTIPSGRKLAQPTAWGQRHLRCARLMLLVRAATTMFSVQVDIDVLAAARAVALSHTATPRC